MDRSARRRAAVLGGAFALLFFGLLFRLWAIQVGGHEAALTKRISQTRGEVRTRVFRGGINDARGQALAVTVPVESVWADPSMVSDPEAAAGVLARTLHVPAAPILARLRRPGRRFEWIKRKVTPEEADAVRALMERPLFRPAPHPPLGLTRETARRYPQGRALGQVLGLLNENPAMHEGIERSLDPYLGGEIRTLEVKLDGRRRILGLPDCDVSGADLTLTVDMILQGIMEEELTALCEEFTPKWAVAVAMDPRTGAVLGMAVRPAYDPNVGGAEPASNRRNRAIVDPYEPGSTLKPFVAAYALEHGLVRPDSIIFCENGAWRHGARTLHDHHPYGDLTVSQIVEKSSNVGAAKIGVMMGPRRLHECMSLFGFGRPTGIELPAESGGMLHPLSRWDSFSITSVPIGHEIAVTPLQLVTAMSTIAGGGVLRQPFIVKRVTDADGTILAEREPRAVRRVLRETTAREMVAILRRVVEHGTGKRAKVDGVTVGGKTGTTQKVDPATGRYSHSKYIASFTGFAPAEAARICVAVVVDEPQGKYYGGSVAAPTVGRIIGRALIHVE